MIMICKSYIEDFKLIATTSSFLPFAGISSNEISKEDLWPIIFHLEIYPGV